MTVDGGAGDDVAAGPPRTVYELVGAEFFVELVERFYDGVARDPVLRPLYPGEELSGAKARLTGFLVQYWGGPTDYSDARGHPRLRMRHAPFVIGPAERDAWLAHMTRAIDETVDNHGFPPELAQLLHDYFGPAATHMINTQG
jgi:hemoglobin